MILCPKTTKLQSILVESIQRLTVIRLTPSKQNEKQRKWLNKILFLQRFQFYHSQSLSFSFRPDMAWMWLVYSKRFKERKISTTIEK